MAIGKAPQPHTAWLWPTDAKCWELLWSAHLCGKTRPREILSRPAQNSARPQPAQPSWGPQPGNSVWEDIAWPGTILLNKCGRVQVMNNFVAIIWRNCWTRVYELMEHLL